MATKNDWRKEMVLNTDEVAQMMRVSKDKVADWVRTEVLVENKHYFKSGREHHYIKDTIIEAVLGAKRA